MSRRGQSPGGYGAAAVDASNTPSGTIADDLQHPGCFAVGGRHGDGEELVMRCGAHQAHAHHQRHGVPQHRRGGQREVGGDMT